MTIIVAPGATTPIPTSVYAVIADVRAQFETTKTDSEIQARTLFGGG